ncbi:Aste57867_8196 [Aphanomyces stellatus]|uniref:Aste57867_8196 protein n=1 Tax=Aphanomyces stellatus TaxID=120398 RepID=A0A485KJL9_9STRA|nr:hypothetical protein As57867_008165 [Aphanomyces stellatus]VFT85084.1 Aste57867_8196 [Aphanomyces stellatus]
MDDPKLYQPFFFGVSGNFTALHIDCDRTFVVEDPDATTGARVEGLSSPGSWDGLLTTKESIDDNGNTVLTMECGASSSMDAYLVNVYVPTRSIRAVTFAAAGGTLVIYPDTLVNAPTDSISITNANAGTVFVQDRALSIQNLHLHAAGAGSIQWDVPTTVVAAAADLRTSDAGNVTLFASNLFLALEMKASTAGRGDIAISSANMTVLTHLVTDIAGSGDVVYKSNPHGTCNTHAIKQMGPGTAFTSSLVCATTTVVSASTGDTFVASTTALDVDQMGSGQVYLDQDTWPSVSGPVLRSPMSSTIPAIVHVSLPPHALNASAKPYEQPTNDPATDAIWKTRGGIQRNDEARGPITALDLDCGRSFVIESPVARTVKIDAITNSPYYHWHSYGQSQTMIDGEMTLKVVCVPTNNSEPHYVNIYVSTQSIRKITSRADGDVVVYPNTLASSNTTNLTIQNAGSGNIFVQDSTVTAHTLSLHADTSGSIQWNVPTTVVAHTLDLQTAAGGSIFLFASTTLAAQSLVATTQASGSIAVEAATMTVSSMITNIAGAGSIVYSATASTCGSHSIKQMGPGNAYTSAIGCVDTTVLAASTGDIYVASTTSFDVNQMGSGNVYLQQVVPLPPHVSGSYQLLPTNPRTIMIPHVPVPPHALTSQQPTQPTPQLPRVEFSFLGTLVLLFVILGLCYAVWRWFARRNNTTKLSTTTNNEASALCANLPATYQHDPTSHEFCQSLPEQQQLYNPNSGTINYVGTGGASVPLHQLQPREIESFVPQDRVSTQTGGNLPRY